MHLPWCVRKCPYCDFNSHPTPDGELPETAYRARLLQDLSAALEREQRPIETVFFGGGTPSLFSPDTFAAVLAVLEGQLAPGAEVTMEVNPGAREYHDFRGYRDAGVNRLSVGAQSFDDGMLDALGRVHGSNEIRTCIEAARAGGFDNLNIDLMHGLPEQSADGAMSDLHAAIELQPTHVSWYQLTIEPRTEFAGRPPALPDESVLGDIEARGVELLARAGFERYEVSAYAQPGKRCAHNINYWRFGDYLGVGAGAHSKLSQLNSKSFSVERQSVARQPRLYLDGPPSRTVQAVSAEELPAEFMMNALRLLDGVEPELFEAATGVETREIEHVLARLRDTGLLRPDRLAVTDEGLRFLDTVVAEFLG